jgi:hypothetical protein
VRAILQSEAVQASLQQRLNDARRVMEAEVEAALEAERRKAQEELAAKQAAIEAKQQELEELQREREEAVCACLVLGKKKTAVCSQFCMKRLPTCITSFVGSEKRNWVGSIGDHHSGMKKRYSC